MPKFDKGAVLPLSPAEFTTMVSQHQAALCSFLCGLVGNIEQGCDLAQDVFQDAWRIGLRAEMPFIQGASPDAMRRWLFQAAYFRAISALRRRRRIHWESLEQSYEREPETFAAPILFENEIAEREALRATLQRLSPEDVACLLLRVVQGFSAKETAEIIGVSSQTIDQRLSRAKQRLRSIYLIQEAEAANSLSSKEAR